MALPTNDYWLHVGPDDSVGTQHCRVCDSYKHDVVNDICDGCGATCANCIEMHSHADLTEQDGDSYCPACKCNEQ